jgi:hypothetical protein
MNLTFIKFDSGWLSEWSMEAVLKTVGLIAPGVRIPHHPKYTDVQVPAETGRRKPAECSINFFIGEMPERPKGTVC